jgi:hypothetical protein
MACGLVALVAAVWLACVAAGGQEQSYRVHLTQRARSEAPRALKTTCARRLARDEAGLAYWSTLVRVHFDQPLYIDGAHALERVYSQGRLDDVDASLQGAIARR